MQNDRDTHDMEKLENLYNEVIEEGIFNRAGANVKSYGQAAGAWARGIGRSLVGKGNAPARVLRLYYKLGNVVKNYANDINVLAGANTYDDEVYTLLQAIHAIRNGSGPEKAIAQELADLINKKIGKKARPRKISDLDKLIR